MGKRIGLDDARKSAAEDFGAERWLARDTSRLRGTGKQVAHPDQRKGEALELTKPDPAR